MDDFESGTLSAWTTVNALVTQQQVVYAGSYAARATSAGQVAYARKHLSSGQNDLYVSLWIDSLSQGTSWVYPLRLQTTSGSQLLGIYISGGSSSGTLGYYNNVTNTSTNGGVAISRGAWHSIELHVQINGTTSRIEAWLDGTPVPALTGTTALGTVPIGWVQIGDSVLGASYDVAFDNCTINTRFIAP